MSQSDFVTRGQALVNSGQYQEAVKVCRLGLLGRPTTVEGRIVLGQALLALKRYDEVLAEMRVALELDHTSVNAQVLKAEALLSKGDAHAAIEVLDKLRPQAPNDPRIDSLIGIGQRSLGTKPLTASHPSVGFVGNSTGDNTRHYPNHANHDDDGEETTGGSFNQATAVSSPAGSKKRSSARPVQPEPVAPPSHVLAVGDKSGTVEVDPDADGIELDSDEDFGDVASPPRSRQLPAIENQRGQLFSVGGVPAPRRPGGLPTPGLERARGGKKNRVEMSSVELIEDDLVEIDSGETLLPDRRQQPGPGTRVRNAVNVPSGPLDGVRPVAGRPTAPEQVPPPHLAQMIANAPHVLEVARAQPSMTMRGNPGGPIVAALPTLAAQHPPGPPAPINPMAATAIGMPVMTQPNPNAVRPTLAIPAEPMHPHMPQSASPAWARQTVAANQQIHQNLPGPGMMPGQAHHEASTSPAPLDASIASLLSEGSTPSASALMEPSQSGVRALKTGMRKGRSRLQIAIWLVIGALVIAGGVFVGFKFRAMRLEKKIADTRDVALGLAKADTWKALVRARDRLAGIAQASPTGDNKAALARTRAQIAFEFGDGLAEAKTAVDGLGGQAGIDVELAATYLALAQNDAKTALNAADRATKLGVEDPATHYVTGQAHLLVGDATAALEHLKKAVDKEARPLYLLALARAYAENTDWAQALKVVDPAKIKAWYDAFDPDTVKELGTTGIDLAQISTDHPGVAIERTGILVSSAKVGTKGLELRGALEKIVAEGGKPLNDQVRGVSPTQIAFAHLALSALDFYLGNKKSQADFNAALAVGLDDQRFAEHAIETAYLTTDFTRAQKAGEIALKAFPNSRRTRIVLAKVLLAQGNPNDARDLLAKLPDVDKLAKPLAVRGQIKLALNDLAGAKDDFDRALAQTGMNLEEALVGRAWVDLGLGEIDAARKRLLARFQAAPSVAVTTVWAAILTAGSSSEDKKTAKMELERVVNGPVTLDTWRAQLQLARLNREIGDEGAKIAYSKAFELTGSTDIRIETATYLIDYQKPGEGLDMLEALLKTTTPPSAELLLETARANLLVGKHPRGTELLDQADKLQTVTRWKYDRERGRLALRKASFNDAAIAFEAALDKCGDDVETFYLASEVAVADDKKPNTKLIDKIKKLAAERLKDRPERKIVEAKLLSSKGDEASKLYTEAKVAIGEAASPRRRSQAALGLGIVAYNRDDDPTALGALDLAFTLDPTLYEAYLYYADIKKTKEAGKERENELGSALDKAKKAIEFNPDSVDAYVMVGVVAHKLGNRKLLAEMTTKVNALAPGSDQLKALQALR